MKSNLQVPGKMHSPPSGWGWCLPLEFYLIFLVIGWGDWGMGVLGDPTLDLADGLRVFQGDVPYRDFLPTYSPLAMYLISGFYHFGGMMLNAWWGFVAILIGIQVLSCWFLIRSISNDRTAHYWSLVLLAVVVFIPSNSKWILGYSVSGYLATLIWCAGLMVFWFDRPLKNSKGWFLLGMLWGLLPATKADMGLIGLALTLFFPVVMWKRDGLKVLLMPLGFLLMIGIIFGGSALRAGDWKLICETMDEAFGQAGIFGDALLKKKIFLLIMGVMVMAWSRSASSNLRRRFHEKRTQIRMAIYVLLACALFLDAWRGFHSSILRGPVLTQYLMIIVWGWILGRTLNLVIRDRGFKVFRIGKGPWLGMVLVVSGMGILRVALTGWYPLNYDQPALFLLLAVTLVRMPISDSTCWSARAVCGGAWLGALIFAGYSLYISARSMGGCHMLSIPWGTVRICENQASVQTLKSFSDLSSQISGDQSIFCSYEPSMQWMTGRASAAWYTYFNRLGASGKYRERREREALSEIQTKQPGLVVLESERAQFSKHFGDEYGHEMYDWILKNYIPAGQSEMKSTRKWVVMVHPRNKANLN